MLAFFVPVEQSSVYSNMILRIYFGIGWFGITGGIGYFAILSRAITQIGFNSKGRVAGNHAVQAYYPHFNNSFKEI
jgi:hypothetical protein